MIDKLFCAAALSAGIVLTAPAAGADEAQTTMHNSSGEEVGSVTLVPTENGVLLHAKLENMPEGTHAFHIHETGQCDPPSFTSAGGHHNPTAADHGFFSNGGVHAGDMPNIHVPASGSLEIEVLNVWVGLDGLLLDDDGAAIVVHEGADDYRTDPAGDAGSRIACGVIKY